MENSTPSRPVALVTGGSRGIGLGIARRLQADGAAVAVTYKNAPPAELSGPEGSVDLLPIACDSTDAAQVDAAFSLVESTFGPVSVLVANAGITKDTLILRMKDDDWNQVIDTNLTGVYRVVRRAVGPMVKAHSGRIILISSVVGFMGSPGQVNYGASKAALMGMARSLAREVGSRNITVNVVAPGIVETDMIAALGQQRIDQMKAMVPLGRATDPQEVAGTVAFLASPDAAYITGAVIPVDGGMAMGL